MNKEQHIYQQMLKAIVEQQLKPGLRLPEDKLAVAFETSRTGIRNVLQRLALERFVTVQPNKGAHVARPSITEARQVLASRIMVEPLLMEAVINAWAPRHQQTIEALLAAEEESAQDVGTMIDLTARFHIELAKCSGNDVMADFVKQLALRSSLVVAVYGSEHSVGCQCGSHRTLVELIAKGQVGAAMSWMQQHLEHIRNSLSFTDNVPVEPDFKAIFSPLN